jgi:DNA-binding IclR family transcriptional regulator
MGQSVSGVGVLDKAIDILGALETGPLTLNELATATSLPRATAHRLALALQRHLLVDRDDVGRFVLGPGLVRLGGLARVGSRGSLIEAAAPALAALRDQTGESAQLYIRAGDTRVCVASLESPHSLRTIVAVGAVLPMDRGSAAKVLAGDAAVLRQGWAQSVEERERGVASVSAPVTIDAQVVAAVSVSGPIGRTTREPGRRYAGPVVAAARAVELTVAEGSGRRRQVAAGAG